MKRYLLQVVYQRKDGIDGDVYHHAFATEAERTTKIQNMSATGGPYRMYTGELTVEVVRQPVPLIKVPLGTV